MVANQPTQSDDKPGYARVVASGVIPPNLPRELRNGVKGFVRKDGKISLEGISGLHLKLSDQDAIEPRTDVHVERRRGAEWAIPVDEYEIKQYEEKAKAHLEAREARKREEKRKRDAERFWNRYDIPIEYGTAIKVRRSGLQRGSAGNGRAADTVQHFHVKEGFTEGRLSRTADSFLCEKDSHIFKQNEEPQLDSELDLERKVTCETCLDRMERWKSTGDE